MLNVLYLCQNAIWLRTNLTGKNLKSLRVHPPGLSDKQIKTTPTNMKKLLDTLGAKQNFTRTIHNHLYAVTVLIFYHNPEEN